MTVADLKDADKLRELYDSNWSLEIFWFPFNSLCLLATLCLAAGLKICCPCCKGWNPDEDNIWIRKINKKSNSDELNLGPNTTPTTQQFRGAIELVQSTFGRSFSHFLNRNPSFVPAFLKTGLYAVKKSIPKESYDFITDAIHYRQFIEVFPVLDMEYAFCAKDFNDQVKAIGEVVQLCKQNYDNNKFPLSVAMEMRWIKTSNALLCPAKAVEGDPKDPGKWSVANHWIIIK